MGRFHTMTRWGAMVLALAAAGLAGCGEDGGVSNRAPEVTISASETTTTMGAQVTLIAVATDKDGDPLIYQWSAESGTFSETDNDTVTWTAPEEEAVFTITVKVNDDVNITTATIDIGVDVYVPTVQPYYLGSSTCQTCHSGVATAWAETNHANAHLTDTHGATYCFSCHDTGYDETVANGGYDEQPISTLEGVQCESCHGPGSAHVAGNGDVTKIQKSLDESDSCESCHTSSRTTFWTDWASSAHGTVTSGYPGAGRAGCSKCHSGNGFIEWAENGTDPPSYATDVIDINCVTCHDPHSAANEHQIRKMDPVTFPDGELVTSGGAGLLCMSCHNGRRDDTDIDDHVTNGSSHFGPHRGNQGSFLFPDTFYDVTGGTFTFSSTNHINIEDSCATCHMKDHGPPNTIGLPSVTSHAFEPTTEACTPCHGAITDFDDILAKQDFDGNGLIEGVQTEVTGLLTLMETAIAATGLDSIAALGLQTAVGKPDTHDVWTPVINAGINPVDVRKAAYNYFAVSFDGSLGIHNAAFAIQLLQQSYLFLTGNPIPGGYMLQPGER